MSGEEEKCECENPAAVSDIDPSVGGEARVAEVEVCDDRSCELAHFLVRGDHVSFVSERQAERVGEHKLDPAKMPSDIVLPSSYVIVHDAVGRLLSKCDVYVLKWVRGKPQTDSEVRRADLRVARDYFGPRASIRSGSVALPSGNWAPKALVRFIRYRRFGFAIPFEHRYDPPVELMQTASRAYRLPLPEGCVIDNRGFVRP
jgi:hypothetical protein